MTKTTYKIIVLVLLSLLTGCAAPKQPDPFEHVASLQELNWIKTGGKAAKAPIKIYVGKGLYNKDCPKEPIALASVLHQRVVDCLSTCNGTYELVEDWQQADLIIEFPVKYLGRSKDSAYSSAIPASAMFSLGNKPGQEIANTLTKELMGQSVRNGAASSLAGLLFMAYDIGNFIVDGIQAIGHLYASCLVTIRDNTPQQQGGKPQLFQVVVAATIDLEGDDRAANIAKFVPQFTDPIVSLFVNDQICRPLVVKDDENELSKQLGLGTDKGKSALSTDTHAPTVQKIIKNNDKHAPSGTI